jgi:hypothetical protein
MNKEKTIDAYFDPEYYDIHKDPKEGTQHD